MIRIEVVSMASGARGVLTWDAGELAVAQLGKVDADEVRAVVEGRRHLVVLEDAEIPDAGEVATVEGVATAELFVHGLHELPSHGWRIDWSTLDGELPQ